MDSVASAIFVAVFVKAAIDRIADIVRAAMGQPEADIPWLAAVAFVVGGGLSYLLSLNVFSLIPDATVGKALTAVAVGGGVEFLNSMLASVQNRNVTVFPDEPVRIVRPSDKASMFDPKRGW